MVASRRLAPRATAAAAIAAAATALAGCSSDTSLPAPARCNPLGIHHCMTPWPSSAFEIDDASAATGRRLAIPEGTLPANIDGMHASPAGWNTADGFSPAAPLVMAWKGGVSPDGLPPADNMDISMTADSPTVILDMTTGERVAHFAEIDLGAERKPDSQALLLRPAARLAGGHRYAAAITRRVRARDGEPLDVPPGFAALRDGRHTDHELLEAMRPRFAEVFEALEAAGIPDDDLVLAWDFTVASDAYLFTDAATARDRAVAALAARPIAYEIATDETDPAGPIRRKITGTLDAPLFLTSGGAAAPGTKLARDEAGLPALQGFYKIPFTAIVPACAYAANQPPVPMVLYGHGLMGNSGETAGSVQRTTAAELCMVLVGTDLRGMSTMDLPAVARTLGELSFADELFEVITQGLVNHVALARAMRTTFAEALLVDGGKSLVDPARVYYYGLSQGGIFGTAILAYEPTITRGVLGVGAASYAMLLDRSADWPLYQAILNGAYHDLLDVTLAINLFQMRWDKVEGSGVAHVVTAGAPTGVPPKQVLMQVAVGDEQVPNLGSWWQARTMKIPVLGPSPTTPWGLTVHPSPLAGGSALVIMDGGAPPVPTGNVPPADKGMHNLTRNQPAARRQIKEFFATGRIVNECAGACTCQTGACN
ncbi:MAG TPA: hypothetical protein VNO30_42300 [Kofleriaceae bacterium]|nr:hypothetical protein [Kofleriaceae bacterium]